MGQIYEENTNLNPHNYPNKHDHSYNTLLRTKIH